jgi:uncharacterized FlaG/YvyC family protein
MMKRYQVGPDHLMDFLEKRIIALEWKMPTVPPWEETSKEVSGNFKEKIQEKEVEKQKQEEQEKSQEKLQSVLKKMNALTEWGINL